MSAVFDQPPQLSSYRGGSIIAEFATLEDAQDYRVSYGTDKCCISPGLHWPYAVRKLVNIDALSPERMTQGQRRLDYEKYLRCLNWGVKSWRDY